jgi:very-short-patch-repair endonuclease
MSAAALWGLLRPVRGPVDVSTSARSGRARRTGIYLRRCTTLTRGSITERLHIPVTPPARTIEDLQGEAPPHLVRRAIRQAELAKYRLGPGRWTVDFLWRTQGIAVETDFYDYHRGRVAFRDDRARELGLRRHGLAVHRFSEEQVNDEPEEVATDLRDALGLAS